MKKKLLTMLGVALFAISNMAMAAVSVVDQAGAHYYLGASSTNTVASFTNALSGDYVVVVAGIASKPAFSVYGSGTATVDTFTELVSNTGYHHARCWYAPVTGDGALDVQFGWNSEVNNIQIGTYLVRASAGYALAVLDTSAVFASPATSLTNSYSFAAEAAGMVIEGVVAKAGGLAAQTPGMTIDYSNVGKRCAASGTFTLATSLETSYTAASGDFGIAGVALGEVSTANVAPEFSSNPIDGGLAPLDLAYSGSITATDLNGDSLTYAKDSGPAWLTVATNGTLSGTPVTGVDSAGTNSWTVSVTDGALTNTATLNIVVTGNQPPAFDSNPINGGVATEDSPYGGSITATDPESDPLTYAKDSGPAWLTVATNGVLSGTPFNANVGSNNWTVSVTDGVFTDTATLTIVVTNVNDAPVFDSDPIEESTYVDNPFSGTITATDVDAGDSLIYAKDSGPDWLTVSTNGVLTGEPTSAHIGTNTWTVSVSDGNGGSDTATLNIVVSVPPDIFVSAQDGASFSGVSATNTFASFANARAGDYVVLVAGMQAAYEGPNYIGTTGTATVDPFTAVDAGGSYWNAYCYYAPVTGDGTLDVQFGWATTGNNYSHARVYLVRSATGYALEVLGTSTASSSATVSLTNSYSFASASSGMVFEGVCNQQGSLTADTAGMTIDSNNQLKRAAVSGTFSAINPFESAYTQATSGQFYIAGVALTAAQTGDPAAAYDGWVASYAAGMGGLTALTDDADGDFLNNLAEYAFGGDPANAADRGNVPVASVVDNAGTKYLHYVYLERTDAATRGLASTLVVGADLVNTNWTTSGIELVGSGASGVEGFNAVTNRIPMDGAKEFLNLQIEFTP